MSTKFTHTFVKDHFKKLGCILLDQFIDTSTPMKYMCKCNNLCTASYSNFRKTPYCSDCRKYDIFKTAGCQLIRVVKDNLTNKCTFKCVCGQLQTVSYSTFKERRMCTDCWKRKKKEIKQALHYKDMVQSRTIIGYDDWRAQVLLDNPCCPCGSYMNLVAHHINSYTKYPEKRLEISNGFVLCKKHHDEYHQRHGRDGDVESLIYYIENEMK